MDKAKIKTSSFQGMTCLYVCTWAYKHATANVEECISRPNSPLGSAQLSTGWGISFSLFSAQKEKEKEIFHENFLQTEIMSRGDKSCWPGIAK